MTQEEKLKFGTSKKIKQIARIALPGGGQVVVENGYGYVGHMDPPHGTSIVDAKDLDIPGSSLNSKSPKGSIPTRFRSRAT